jgi:signal transduction histidine kinase
VVGVVQLAATVGATQRVTDRRPVDLVAIALLAAGPALLHLRHRMPVLVLLGNFVSTGLYYALNYRFGPAALSLVVAMVSAVAAGRRSAAWLLTVLGLPSYLLASALFGRQDGPGPVAVVAIAAVLCLALAVGEAVRVTGVRRVEADRVNAAERRRRVSEERLQVARDLHDVLAHHVSLVNVQASVALRLFDRDPGQARASVAAIKEISREILDDLGAALAVLRRDSALPRRPTTGLDQLDEILDRSAAAGLRVQKLVSGVPRPLATAVDLAALRIVQEAITNVRRHAGADRATLRIGYEDAALVIVVINDGPVPSLPVALSTGDGIGGMRERAASLGGTFEAGRQPTGGFRVYARLPYRRPS